MQTMMAMARLSSGPGMQSRRNGIATYKRALTYTYAIEWGMIRTKERGLKHMYGCAKSMANQYEKLFPSRRIERGTNQNEEAGDEEEHSGRTKNHVLLEDLTSQETPLSKLNKINPFASNPSRI